jgi:uncharacterized protein
VQLISGSMETGSGHPTSTSRDLVQSLYDAFAKGDAATVLGALHPEAQWIEAENSPYADHNPYIGPASVGKDIFARIMSDFHDFTVSPEQFAGDGDMVVAMGRYRGTCSRTGKRLDAQFAHAWSLQNGRVMRFQQYTDTAQGIRTLAD